MVDDIEFTTGTDIKSMEERRFLLWPNKKYPSNKRSGTTWLFHRCLEAESEQPGVKLQPLLLLLSRPPRFFSHYTPRMPQPTIYRAISSNSTQMESKTPSYRNSIYSPSTTSLSPVYWIVRQVYTQLNVKTTYRWRRRTHHNPPPWSQLHNFWILLLFQLHHLWASCNRSRREWSDTFHQCLHPTGFFNPWLDILFHTTHKYNTGHSGCGGPQCPRCKMGLTHAEYSGNKKGDATCGTVSRYGAAPVATSIAPPTPVAKRTSSPSLPFTNPT